MANVLDEINIESDCSDADFHLEDGEDAMTRYGSGMLSYFTLIKINIGFFALISLVFLPVMYSYASWHALHSNHVNPVFQYSIGNLGESGMHCSRIKMTSEHALLSCSVGVIDDIVGFGVYELGSEAENKNLCSTNDDNFETGLVCNEVSSDTHPIREMLEEKCIGKRECKVDNYHDVVPLGSQSFGSDCVTTPTTTLYLEYYCRVTDHDLAIK